MARSSEVNYTHELVQTAISVMVANDLVDLVDHGCKWL